MSTDHIEKLEVKEKKSRLTWMKSKMNFINSKAIEIKNSTEEKIGNINPKYKPDYLLQKSKPYIEKAILIVAIAAASETLSDEEKMESIYFWLLKLIPGPIRVFLPEKLIFKMIWSARSELITKVDEYRDKINQADDKETEIKFLTEKSEKDINENSFSIDDLSDNLEKQNTSSEFLLEKEVR